MARSTGSIHIADNSPTSINDAIQQLLFMIDELRGEHDSLHITIGPHSHTSTNGGKISHDTGLDDVSANDHHDQLHSSHHGPGQDDALKLDDCATPDDNTDLNVNIASHGLTPKLPNDVTKYLDGTGAWSVVPGSTEAVDVANVEASGTTQIWEQIFSNDGSVTITVLANGEALNLAASSSGGGSIGRTFMLMGA